MEPGIYGDGNNIYGLVYVHTHKDEPLNSEVKKKRGKRVVLEHGSTRIFVVSSEGGVAGHFEESTHDGAENFSGSLEKVVLEKEKAEGKKLI